MRLPLCLSFDVTQRNRRQQRASRNKIGMPPVYKWSCGRFSAKGATVTDSSTDHRRQLRLARTLGALAFAGPITGCISYSPAQVSAMSSYDLCEAQLYSRINLSAETREQVSNEIRKRNEDCSRQVPAIEANRADQAYDAMYGRSGP
jgi:hypothetical protein